MQCCTSRQRTPRASNATRGNETFSLLLARMKEGISTVTSHQSPVTSHHTAHYSPQNAKQPEQRCRILPETRYLTDAFEEHRAGRSSVCCTYCTRSVRTYSQREPIRHSNYSISLRTRASSNHILHKCSSTQHHGNTY
jgi:hypothetical protein